jgi:hypothetical protein
LLRASSPENGSLQMKNPMDGQLEKRLSQRDVVMGHEGDVTAFEESP